MKIYPLKFYKIYVDKAWGDDENLRYELPNKDEELLFENIPKNRMLGETWLLSDSNPKSIVKNGELKGKNFAYLMDNYSKRILGEDTPTFPLTIKYISAKEDTPYYVYPRNKTKIIYSLKDNNKMNAELDNCDLDVLDESVLGEEIIKKSRKIELSVGDFVYIKPGTVHSYSAGFEGFEITDNANYEYRIYDKYEEISREDITYSKGLIEKDGEIRVDRNVMFGSRFNIRKVNIEGREIIEEDEYMRILILLEGRMTVETNDDIFDLEKDEVMLIPRDVTGYAMIGYARYLDITMNIIR